VVGGRLMLKWRWHVLAALVFCVGTASARVVETPSKELKSKWITLVSAVVAEPAAEDRIALTVVESLSVRKATAAEVVVRAPVWAVASLTKGDRVIAAYLTMRRDPTLTDYRIIDPKGPRLLMTGGLEPALFRDNALTRQRLLDAEGNIRPPELPEVMSGLTDSDPQWQNYYARELATRADLREAVNARALKSVEAAMRNRDLHPSARAALFRAAPLFRVGDADWWHPAANEALQQLPISLTPSATDTNADLVRAVFDLFSAQSVPPVPAGVERWVTCAVPALVESSLLVIRKFQPAREDALIAQALAQTLLPPATRGFLLDHDRRLKIMRAALAQRDAQ